MHIFLVERMKNISVGISKKVGVSMDFLQNPDTTKVYTSC
jgi:hypothetical protein